MARVENLENVDRPVVTRDDVRALVASVGDGTYRASELYDRYAELTREAGRTPASKSTLGLALRNAGQLSKVLVIKRKNIRVWTIRAQYLAWLTPDPS